GSGRAGRTPASAVGRDTSAPSTEPTLSTEPLKALAGPGLSGWSDMMELLRREKYRERMVALRGRPSLTVCAGKAEMRGRLEAKGESSGVVTAVRVNQRRRWYYEVTLVGASKDTRVGWARCGGAFSVGVSSDDEEQGGKRKRDAAVPKLGHGSDSWGICGHNQGRSYH
ncbi:unnamed protein product, partial [Ectocarpus sp. 8 AP-2014]